MNQADGVALSKRDLEAVVLGASLIDKSAAVHVALSTNPAMYSGGRRAIAKTIQKLVTSGKDVDIVTVTAALTESGDLKAAGGASGVAELVDAVPDVANVQTYTDALQTLWRRERVVSELTMLKAKLEAGTVDVDEALGTIIRTVSDTTPDSRKVVMAAKLAGGVLDHVVSEETGDSVRIDILSPPLLPLRPSGNIVIAGVTGTGKSALADYIALQAAVAGWPVLILGLEMSPWERVARLMATISGVSISGILTRQLPFEAFDKLKAAEARLKRLPVAVGDAAGLTLSKLVAMIRQEVAARAVKLVVVDYLQLVNARKGNMSRESEVALVSRTLTQLATSEGFLLVAVSQLSRASQKEKRPPTLHDLRDSGQIEQDAAAVVMLGQPVDSERGRRVQAAYIRKQRFGQVGQVALTFHGPTLRFRRVPEEGQA